jgi:hypothetical protein
MLGGFYSSPGTWGVGKGVHILLVGLIKMGCIHDPVLIALRWDALWRRDWRPGFVCLLCGACLGLGDLILVPNLPENNQHTKLCAVPRAD